MTAPEGWRDVEVIAEAAPIGVQLWPTRHPKYAPNFTLERVETVLDACGRPYVRWTYRGGNTAAFRPGERIAARVPAAGRGDRVTAFLAAWHGCLEHNRDHCPDCQTCDHYAPEATA